MNEQPSPFFRILLVMASIVIVVLGLRAGSSVVTPILFTLIIGLFAIPVQLGLIQYRVPPLIAFLSVFAMTSILIILTLFAFSILATAVEGSLQAYQAQLAARVDELVVVLEQYGVTVVSSSDLITIQTQAFNAVSTMLEALAASLSNAFLVILILFFLLMDAPGILGRVQNSPGAQTALFRNAIAYFDQVRGSLYRVTGFNLLQALYIALFLAVMQVDFAVLWGLLAFVLLYIPVAGIFIAAAPAIFIAFVVHGLPTAVIVALGIIAVPLLFQRFMRRRFLPPGENISLLVIFFAIAFAVWIFGLAGLLLAVPLVVMMRIIFESFPETSWAAVLISGHQENPPPVVTTSGVPEAPPS